MNVRVWAFALTACALLGNAQPVAADQLADVRASMKAAAAKLSSFRMLMTSPMGFASSGTFLMSPRRSHLLVSGIVSIDTYTIDNVAYTKIGTSAWKKQQLPPAAVLSEMISGMLSGEAAHITLGDDVIDGGLTFGTMQIVVDVAKMLPNAPPIPPLTMSCSYDKRTFLMASCKTPMFTETFEGYNDPANAVALPPDALAAVDAGPLVLPGAAAPSPAASPSAAP